MVCLRRDGSTSSCLDSKVIAISLMVGYLESCDRVKVVCCSDDQTRTMTLADSLLASLAICLLKGFYNSALALSIQHPRQSLFHSISFRTCAKILCITMIASETIHPPGATYDDERVINDCH